MNLKSWDEKKLLAVLLCPVAGLAFGVNFYFAIRGSVFCAVLCALVLVLGYMFATKWAKL